MCVFGFSVSWSECKWHRLKQTIPPLYRKQMAGVQIGGILSFLQQVTDLILRTWPCGPPFAGIASDPLDENFSQIHVFFLHGNQPDLHC